MNELDFRQWLNHNQVSRKMQSDFISRIKKVERSIENCDIDEQYRSDRCSYLLSLFKNKGINPNMSQYSDVDLPIGTYYLCVYKHAITKYIQFLDESSNVRQQ
ncbi:MAG: hypothetical protein ACI4EQ_09530 [Lachnospiraceae bacterium]